ncbi:MAG: hypothetical protein E7363_00520 [Clostridiales bacterium]|nr:hypothetical protein [Clostridiales bacterium]
MNKRERDSAYTRIKKEIVAYLSTKKSASVSELMDRALGIFTLSPQEKMDKSPNGRKNVLRSLIGTAIAEMKKDEVLSDLNSEVSLLKSETVVITEEKCKTALLSLVKCGSYTKAEVFAFLERTLGTDKTLSVKDDETLHSITGQILSRFLKDGALVLEDGKYKKPETPFTTPTANKSLKDAFLAKIHGMGGAFLERFTVNLFSKYFPLIKKSVTLCQVSGGAADGGIDGIVDTVDDLGFAERMMIQTKNRNPKNQVTEKEVREFYGAVNAKNGSRGAYVTTSSFHSGATKLLTSLPDCIGIDGNRLFELAVETGYGIKKTRFGYTVDESVFVK